LDIWEKTENEPEDGLRERVRTLVEFLNSSMPISQPLEILSKNDWRANRFMSALVEDRTRNDVSYVEFLCQVHKKIQFKFHG
jgi:protein transport protein SEC24